LREIIQGIDHKVYIRLQTHAGRHNAPLMTACDFGVLDAVDELLKKRGTHVWQQNDDGMSALMLAAESNQLEILHRLLRQPNVAVTSTLVDREQRGALEHAAKFGHLEAVRIIFCSGLLDDQKIQHLERAVIAAAENGFLLHSHILQKWLFDVAHMKHGGLSYGNPRKLKFCAGIDSRGMEIGETASKSRILPDSYSTLSCPVHIYEGSSLPPITIRSESDPQYDFISRPRLSEHSSVRFSYLSRKKKNGQSPRKMKTFGKLFGSWRPFRRNLT
jgi:hypothetical protein